MIAPGDYLRQEIRAYRELTDKPFGVNVMLMSPFAAEVAKVVLEEKVPVVTTGAGLLGVSRDYADAFAFRIFIGGFFLAAFFIFRSRLRQG